ncbi:hypothetical protein LR021_04660 [Candidatus Bipolaricaulota bacterium]|nr:hypothetical protein [Candidatus Bipolaricaulota bacterium]
MPELREYRLVWAKALIKADFEELDPSIQRRVKVQFREGIWAAWVSARGLFDH